MFYREYSNGSDVSHWKGWLENAQGTVVAFVKETGEVIFSW
jgi:hypothetical protein